ncbi:type II/IV secretion system protein [Dissulfurirhabdus thermomarina]|uniref:Type II/IV secretion system protein n=1 Tax=Dissulfurirhabdus thermomarina TaxID=1765737 RepID=A0A6N9TX90_DISTH|nr:GspE/PulE family protein [Dissulfurirhabdus thermomarina]NDY43096.1 type II/IV secretion system protein [Dissulfurirhabdus thermomarina]NMX24368.1 type II/IV secretion system protein [Dissulfurirhabdus thermomarina]
MAHPYHDPDYLFPRLEAAGYLAPEQTASLRAKLAIPRRRGQDLVQWIHSLKLPRRDDPLRPLEEADILALVAGDRGWRFRRLDPLDLDMEVVTRTLPASFAGRRLVLPVEWDGKTLEVACYDPLDAELRQDVERACKTAIRLSVAPRGDIEQIIREFFGFKKSIAAAQDLLQGPSVDISNLEQLIRLQGIEGAHSDKHIQQAVDHLLQYAMEQRASDIHIEPKRNESVVRLRIDGVLHVVHRLPRVVHEAICSRIKAISRLDIAEKRRPQDGRLKIAWKDDEAEVRVSTVPVAFGEKMVLRLQSADILFRNLEELGFSPRDLETYTRFLQHTYGIVLMTGPTGSGKSTTLYSTLRHLNSPEINIVTVEDPVEMIHEDFNQIAVQPAVDVTFASILRNILRQDPDVIMIGEIRDLETARYAIQAALTGHLVFSTLHTNDAASAVTRLMDLGLPSYLIASTLLGVVAQRLVRMICPRCREELTVPADQLRALSCEVPDDPVRILRGKGCSYCRNTGYWGRIGIYEVLAVSDEIRKMIHDRADEMGIKRQAMKEGMTPLRHDACRKVLEGITTVEEVIRATAT